MTGWFIMIGLALLVFAGLWLVGGMKRRAFEFVGAALILAFAGYQWQGRPGMAGAPAMAEGAREDVAASLIDLRGGMDRNFTSAKRYLVPSDSYARRGDYQGAVQILRGGLRENPRDADLWTATGLQLMIAADGKLSPAAKIAFDRARSADPRHPGPRYFTGLADLREGRPEAALRLWSTLLSGDFRAGDWRAKVQTQRDALGRIMSAVIAEQAAESGSGTPPQTPR